MCSMYGGPCHGAGEPQTFTLLVNPARNYPLDLYFLMDLSGSQAPDLVMLRNISNSISERVLLPSTYIPHCNALSQGYTLMNIRVRDISTCAHAQVWTNKACSY